MNLEDVMGMKKLIIRQKERIEELEKEVEAAAADKNRIIVDFQSLINKAQCNKIGQDMRVSC